MSEEKVKTQKEMVLEYIQKNGKITQLEAIFKLNITRLPARINELEKKDGIPIVRQRVDYKQGKVHKHYTMYMLGRQS